MIEMARQTAMSSKEKRDKRASCVQVNADKIH